MFILSPHNDVTYCCNGVATQARLPELRDKVKVLLSEAGMLERSVCFSLDGCVNTVLYVHTHLPTSGCIVPCSKIQPHLKLLHKSEIGVADTFLALVYDEVRQ